MLVFESAGSDNNPFENILSEVVIMFQGFSLSTEHNTYLECPYESACPRGEACAAGYTGRMCAECSSGWVGNPSWSNYVIYSVFALTNPRFSYYQSGLQCLECGPATSILLPLACFLTVAVVFIIYYLALR